MTGEIQIRVRYAETDRMGLLHHANYLVYFEEGRTALLRDLGSTNGTLVNGHPVNEWQLADNDVVRAGNSEIAVHFG